MIYKCSKYLYKLDKVTLLRKIISIVVKIQCKMCIGDVP